MMMTIGMKNCAHRACGANRKVALQWVEMSLVDFCHFVPTHGVGYYFSGTPTPLVSREQLKGITHMDSTILSKKAAIMEAELFRSLGLLLPRAREIYDTTPPPSISSKTCKLPTPSERD